MRALSRPTSLGLLGFWNSVGLLNEGEAANAGILDGRFAVEWVRKNIAVRSAYVLSAPGSQADAADASPRQHFGGDPDDITIHGQSGGGGAIMTQLVLYDGQKPNYQKAIPRSNQNYAAYKVQDLTVSCPGLLNLADGS